MLLEFLFFDKSKRPQVETFNDELSAQWRAERAEEKADGKEDQKDLPPKITYKDFDRADFWIVRYEKSGNNESVAKQFSEISRRFCEEFSPTILTDESSEYFNKSLYPLINKFERCLRKLLYLKVALCNEEKLKKAVLLIEEKDFGNIYDILFVDHAFLKQVKDEIKELKTRAEIFDAIDRLRERTAWDILIGDSVLTIIKDNFDLLKEYRNDVMHAHNISYDRFKDIRKQFTKANSELEEQISEIVQDSPATIVSPKTVDTLYDKLVAFSDGTEKVVYTMSRVLEFVANASAAATISSETLSNFGKALMLLGTQAKDTKIEKVLSGFSATVGEEITQDNYDNENEVSTRE